MIPESIMGRLINSYGVQDRSLVILDVLSVYLLQQINEAGMLKHMCFKGGNSLRKIFARRPTRFSRDLDFVDTSYQHISDVGFTAEEYYFTLLERLDGKTYHDVHWRLLPLSDDELKTDTLHVEAHFFIHGRKPDNGWEKLTDNVLALQCSFRRPILLPPQRMPLRAESWFKNLEFIPGSVPVLQLEEAIAEKVRAAFQRTNPRDIYDLYDYGMLVFDTELVRSLSILKCWQDRGLYTGKQNFDPEEFFGKLKAENYNWDALRRQVAKQAWLEPKELIAMVQKRYEFLTALPDNEIQLCLDKAQKHQELHNEVWEACKSLASKIR